jgi:hypothetical protein
MDSAIQWLKTEARFASQSDKQDSINTFLAGRAIYERRPRRRGGDRLERIEITVVLPMNGLPSCEPFSQVGAKNH